MFVPLELEINGHTKIIDIAVTDLNSTDIFLGYDWLVKHNPKFNWVKEIIQFTRCLKEYKIQYQDIRFISRTRRMKPTEEIYSKEEYISTISIELYKVESAHN